MKKFRVILALMMVFSLVGCGQSNQRSLDLVSLNEELPLICEDAFDMSNVLASVELTKEPVFGPLEDVYDYDLRKIGMHRGNITQGIVRISPVNAEMYMVLKPVSGKEEVIKEELHTYLENRILSSTSEEDKKLLSSALFEENEDYIALIVSNNNQEVLDRIRDSKDRLFGALSPVSDDQLSSYELSLDMVSEYAIQKPMLTSSRTYMIVKPKEGFEEEVKDAFQSYIKKQEIAFDALPEELDYVKNAMVCELEGYQILIISKDNEKVLEAIESYLK